MASTPFPHTSLVSGFTPSRQSGSSTSETHRSLIRMIDDNETDQMNFPVAGTETESLLGALERNRRTLAWKCGGLDAAGMRATLGPSSVEDDSFSRSLLGHDLKSPWDAVDWDADPDWEWQSAAEDTPEQLTALWREAVARSRAAVAEALADGGLDRLAVRTRWTEAPSLRRITSKASGLLSTSTKRRPSRRAAAPVVPLPAKKSSTAVTSASVRTEPIGTPA